MLSCGGSLNRRRLAWPGMPVHLCLYHVKKSWIKNLLLKVPGPKNGPLRKVMLAELDAVLHSSSEAAARAALDAFYKKYKDTQPAFYKYFQREWDAKLGACARALCRARGCNAGRQMFGHAAGARRAAWLHAHHAAHHRRMLPAGMWASAMRVNRDLGQNTTGAVEGWHSSFKARTSLTKKRMLGRRPDWLVGILVGEVDEHYAYDGRAKAAGARQAARRAAAACRLRRCAWPCGWIHTRHTRPCCPARIDALMRSTAFQLRMAAL